VQFLDICARGGVEERGDCFVEARVGGPAGFEQAGAREEEFRVQLEDLVEFGC